VTINEKNDKHEMSDMSFNIPLVSIITVVFNGEKYIEETIKSVISQKYHRVEYIIIDGGSTDETVNIIKKYKDHVDYWVSESDLGIYDAMNKGVSIARGDWVNFMNAGDYFYDNTTLFSIFKNKMSDTDLIYGDVEILYSNFSRIQKAGDTRYLWRGMQFSHQSMFVRTSLMRQYKFNIHNRIVADFEFVYHLYSKKCSFNYVPLIVSSVVAGGLSDSSRLEVLFGNRSVVGRNDIFYQVFFLKSMLNIFFTFCLKSILPKQIISFIQKIK
jgi:glycosyltransferase involved in cell wall biosynthesis